MATGGNPDFALAAVWAGLSDARSGTTVSCANVVGIKQDSAQHCASTPLGAQKPGPDTMVHAFTLRAMLHHQQVLTILTIREVEKPIQWVTNCH